ncbi:zinc finger BED domain-containing protein 4-like [Hydra vulgaris]|uniref:zinc finger BED domain-containing protein 4-like n=1 Tax=Hydra vulgaris TaxID=6087 RepID=UPI0032E9D032
MNKEDSLSEVLAILTAKDGISFSVIYTSIDIRTGLAMWRFVNIPKSPNTTLDLQDKQTITSLKNKLQNKYSKQYAKLTETPLAKGSKSDDLLTYTNSNIPAVTGMLKKKQLTFKETAERKTCWDINDPKSIKYHYLIGEMIALDNEPLSLVERFDFNHTYGKASISQATAVSVTSDMWICQDNSQSFLSFTAHWISPDFVLEHTVLTMKPFSGSHTGTNIAKELNTIAERWGISHSKIHFLVHDSGANMIKGIIATARRIVTDFNHSCIAQEKLKSIRQELKLPEHQLTQDVSTRWNSTYYLLERLLEQKRAVSLYITDHDSLNNLTPAQWVLMEQCIKLLKPFEEITKITSSGISCISEVIPHVVTLLKYLGK